MGTDALGARSPQLIVHLRGDPQPPRPQEKEAAVQKKSYKVLAYLCEARPDFLQPHFQEVRASGQHAWLYHTLHISWQARLQSAPSQRMRAAGH